MYYKEQYLEEIYDLKHRHDNDKAFVDYEKDILNNSLSPRMFSNNRMFVFLDGLRLLVTKFFDNHNIIKNFKNYNVDKYYYKHKS